MILEAVILDIRPDSNAEFEAAFNQAAPLIAASKGYLGHELQHCMEQANRYLLLVRWETLDDHTVGFRGSDRYQEWRSLLHHFYDPFPKVEHYRQLSAWTPGSADVK